MLLQRRTEPGAQAPTPSWNASPKTEFAIIVIAILRDVFNIQGDTYVAQYKMFLERLSALHRVFVMLGGRVFLCRSGDNGASSEHRLGWHL